MATPNAKHEDVQRVLSALTTAPTRNKMEQDVMNELNTTTLNTTIDKRKALEVANGI